MNILGIGPLELFFVLILMLVVLGPSDMVKTGRQVGRFIRQITRSEMWGMMMNTSREMRDLPTRLVREAGLEEDLRSLQTTAKEIRSNVATEVGLTESTIQPPTPTPAPALTSASTAAASPAAAPEPAPRTAPGPVEEADPSI